MIRNCYWDLFECRWVEYTRGEADTSAAEAVPVPRSAVDAAETAEVPAPAPA